MSQSSNKNAKAKLCRELNQLSKKRNLELRSKEPKKPKIDGAKDPKGTLKTEEVKFPPLNPMLFYSGFPHISEKVFEKFIESLN